MTNPNGKGKWEERARNLFHEICIDGDYATIAQALAQAEEETIERCAKVAEESVVKVYVYYPKGYVVDPNRLCEVYQEQVGVTAKAIRAMGGISREPTN